MNPKSPIPSGASRESVREPQPTAEECYVDFRASRNIKSGEALHFREWMDFAREFAEARLEQAERVLLAISTDLAQDALEDPVGFAEREEAGFYRIGKGVRDALIRYLTTQSQKQEE